jgi:quinoprotein glucose dehydrogenase
MTRSGTLLVLSLALSLFGAAVGARAAWGLPQQPVPVPKGPGTPPPKLDPRLTSTMTGVYSPAQAARGEETYFNICVACHPTPTYTGQAFQAAWANRPLSELFDVIKTTMPKNDPGTLTSAEVVQMIAYILKLNDVPDGNAELPATAAGLKKFRIETPYMRKGNK